MFLIASEYKIKYAWLGVYYFVVYIFFNVGYYYDTEGEDRLTYDVFDWDAHPGKGCLWVFLILAIFVPGFSSFHYFVYRWDHSTPLHCTALLRAGDSRRVRVNCCDVGGGGGGGRRGGGGARGEIRRGRGGAREDERRGGGRTHYCAGGGWEEGEGG